MPTDPELCRLCARAYTGIAEAIADAQGPTEHGPRAFVVPDGDGVTVVFRGTDDVEGWLADFEPILVPYLWSAHIHEGVLDYWDAVSSAILPHCEGKRVTITGHSLGGAMAMPCALSVLPNQIDRVVTFGAPRVGDAAFAKLFDPFADKITRYVNLFDPVPWVPGAMCGYRHAGPARWFDGAVWRPYSAFAYWLTAGVDMIRSGDLHHLSARRLLDDVADCHFIQHYQAALPLP